MIREAVSRTANDLAINEANLYVFVKERQTDT